MYTIQSGYIQQSEMVGAGLVVCANM